MIPQWKNLSKELIQISLRLMSFSSWGQCLIPPLSNMPLKDKKPQVHDAAKTKIIDPLPRAKDCENRLSIWKVFIEMKST